MKILCVADHIDPLVYSPLVKQRFGDVDLVLSAGDLPLNYYDFIVSSLNKPLLFVFGNHNLRGLSRYHRGHDPLAGVEEPPSGYNFDGCVGARYIHGKVVREKGLLIGGLGGSLVYNRGENQFSDFGMFLQAFGLVPRMLLNRLIHGRYIDILLTHAPPLGINDRPDRCHTGFRAFRWFMRAFSPQYLVHGHVHLYDSAAQREQASGDTHVLNAYDHCIIEVEAPRRPRERHRRGSVLRT